MAKIYKEELDAEATTELFSVIQNESGRNVSRNVKCFNLDAIIAVGVSIPYFEGQFFGYLQSGDRPYNAI